MYEPFRLADTPEWEEAFKFALPVIGIQKWEDLLESDIGHLLAAGIRCNGLLSHWSGELKLFSQCAGAVCGQKHGAEFGGPDSGIPSVYRPGQQYPVCTTSLREPFFCHRRALFEYQPLRSAGFQLRHKSFRRTFF